MRMTVITVATALVVSGVVPALAQTTPGGSAEKNMNNPGSVKSNTEKSMERTGSTGADMKPGASGVQNKTPGATAGSGGGNGVTGSTAAPSGK